MNYGNKPFFTGRQFSLLTWWQLLLTTMATDKKLSNIDENQNENFFLAKEKELEFSSNQVSE